MARARVRQSTAALVGVVVAAGSLLSSVRAEARETALSVMLTFVPTDTEEVLEKRGVVPAGGPPFEIQLAVDTRPEPRNLIGENREKETRVPVWARTPVYSWISKTLAETFRDWGTPHTPGAALVLYTEIVKLFVIEEHTYQAEAVMKFSLRRRDGAEIWSGVVGGAASRFGRSLKPDNYNEVLSDAVFACYSKLWTDTSFRDAWSGKKEAQPVQLRAETVKPTPAETLEPEAAMKKILELKDAGFEEDSLVAWIRKIGFLRPLTSDDMLQWKDAGVPQKVIRAAME